MHGSITKNNIQVPSRNMTSYCAWKTFGCDDKKSLMQQQTEERYRRGTTPSMRIVLPHFSRDVK